MWARRQQRGFTLIELMVVIVILGGLVAIVGPNVIGSLKRADYERAHTQLDHIAQSVRMYYFRHRTIPTSLDRLTEVDPQTGEPLMHAVPLDPWGGTYELRREGPATFSVTSAGPDGVSGTEDDIVWPFEVESGRQASGPRERIDPL